MPPEETEFADSDHLDTDYFFLKAPPASKSWELAVRCGITVGLILIFISSITGNVLHPLLHSIKNLGSTAVLVRPSIIWATMGSILLLFRTSLWFSYRPCPACNPDDAPMLTVIIPAYNEGAMVENTIDSVAKADYPEGRLEIFVVDDGSADDTWRYILRAAKRHPQLVTTLRFPKNRGKRAALEAGFRRGRGEIFVTIDSDSVIERQTLLAIAGPFRNPRVGAVAGKVVVYNRREGIIPRMLHVRYILSFDFLRAVQSTYGTVYCCPGALSAYRADVVRSVLDRWTRQTFLGSPCTYGEDRAMTNYILDRGYDSLYQKTAVVHTNAPVTYLRLCKMFLRWDRSYIREELRFVRIVWKRPVVSRIIAIFDTIITNLRYPVSYLIMILLIVLSIQDPMVLVRFVLMMGLLSSINTLYYLHSEKSWDFVYGIAYSYFSFFTLFWIFPAAIFTLRSRSWMTR